MPSASDFVLGIVEGFYGRPWSWRQRNSMLDFVAARGFGFYLYAPKNDPLHRNRWREPYLDDEVAAFARLARRCERLGIELCFGVSPLRFAYDGRDDFDALWSKLRTFHRAGVRSFGILMDDMPAATAGDQASLLNSLWELLRALGVERLTFTPTEYCGSGSSPYLQQLGELLDPEIDVFWTGPEVCSRVLSAEHTRAVARSLRRKPLYWDNYPVNDLEQRYEAHIRPLAGRDPELLAEARGLVAAAGPLAEVPKIALATVAEFVHDPHGYEPEGAWRKALLEVAGDADDATALAVLGDLSRRSALEMGRELENAFEQVSMQFWREWETGDRDSALLRMNTELATLERAAARLEGLRNATLRQELRPWTAKLRGWAEVGREALKGDATRTLRVLNRTRENFHWVMGDQMDEFARRCLRET